VFAGSQSLIENIHVSVQNAAAQNDGQAGWKLQAMTTNMRDSKLALMTWTLTTPPRVTDWATDANVVASLQEVCVVRAGTISVCSSMTCAQSWACAEVNATFRTRTGLRYPAWKVIRDFAKCSRHLKVPTTHKLERCVMNSLAGDSSEWIGLCPAFVHLPQFLAKNVGARFHASLPPTVSDPNGLLLHKKDSNLGKHSAVLAKNNQFAGV